MGIVKMIIPAKIDGDKVVRLLKMPGVADTTLSIKTLISYQGAEFEANDEASVVSLLRGLAGCESGSGSDSPLQTDKSPRELPSDRSVAGPALPDSTQGEESAR